jgi:hypothetical protein
LKEVNGRIYKPPACFTLSLHERRGFYEFLKQVKFPDGYASNLSRCVKGDKLYGLKSHDCHMILQRLLPIGLRGYLDKDVLHAISDLSSFFLRIVFESFEA